MFFAIYKNRSDEPLRKTVRKITSHNDLQGKTPAEKTQLLLAKIAAFLMWRPDYATLEALLQLCAKGRVRRVITYNFDTIFDRLLADKDVTEQLVHSSVPPRVSVFGITSPGPYRWKGFDSDVSPDAVRICHVHGIVDKELEEPEPVIFSETAYRSYQEITLNPGSMQIADAYDQGSLLCVGFSGTDPNFRSVIRQLTRQAQAPVFDNMKHSIYLTHSLREVESYYCIQEDMKPSDQPAAFQCAETFLEMMEHYFRREVGTTILWSKDYEDMARRLKTGF